MQLGNKFGKENFYKNKFDFIFYFDWKYVMI